MKIDLTLFYKILGEEAEWNWKLFFDNIENSEYKDSFIDSLADYSVQVGTSYIFPLLRPYFNVSVLHTGL